MNMRKLIESLEKMAVPAGGIAEAVKKESSSGPSIPDLQSTVKALSGSFSTFIGHSRSVTNKIEGALEKAFKCAVQCRVDIDNKGGVDSDRAESAYLRVTIRVDDKMDYAKQQQICAVFEKRLGKAMWQGSSFGADGWTDFRGIIEI
jgi:hypothetical protein